MGSEVVDGVCGWEERLKEVSGLEGWMVVNWGWVAHGICMVEPRSRIDMGGGKLDKSDQRGELGGK